MSGVMHAPLTGVFLIAELTGGYDLFLPLMIVSVSSYVCETIYMPIREDGISMLKVEVFEEYLE